MARTSGFDDFVVLDDQGHVRESIIDAPDAYQGLDGGTSALDHITEAWIDDHRRPGEHEFLGVLVAGRGHRIAVSFEESGLHPSSMVGGVASPTRHLGRDRRPIRRVGFGSRESDVMNAGVDLTTS